MSSRVVALIDMDAFYVACERALNPALVGVPMAVVQYNPGQGDGRPGSTGVVSHPAEPPAARIAVQGGKVLMPSAANGGIIAVSYEARAKGVTRHMRGREAAAACPDLVIMQVPTAHGKSDMSLYRDYGKRILNIVAEVCGPGTLTEKASVDEMYLDITAPVRRVLTDAGAPATLLEEEFVMGTHVAGDAEGADEASRGEQPTGVRARSSFRAGHSGQVVRAVGDGSAAWWARPAAEWPQDELMLAAGALIVGRARAEVSRRLPAFSCSAGIAGNKMMAKLCGGLHKPNQQTVLPPSAVLTLLDPLPVDRLRGFGGKLGDLIRNGRPDLGLAGFTTNGALRQAGPVAVARLLQGEWGHPEDSAAMACRMAAGLDDAIVSERKLSKQVGSGKNFNRGNTINTRGELEGWIRELGEDVAARLAVEAEENERAATTLVASLGIQHEGAGGSTPKSKRCALRDASVEGIARDGLGLCLQLLAGRPTSRLGVTGLYLSAEAFTSTRAEKGCSSLKRLFENAATVQQRAPVATPVATVACPAPAGNRAEGGGGGCGGGGGRGPGPLFAALARSSVAASVGAAAGPAAPAIEIEEGACEVLPEHSDDDCMLVEPCEPAALQVAEQPSKRAKPEAPEEAPAVAQAWTCSACTLLNAPCRARCDACDTRRTSGDGADRRPRSGPQPTLATFFRT